MPICAYCNKESKLTREHVIPAFMYAAAGGGTVGWRSVPEKMVGGEHKIKDVCTACNSGPLSTLDSEAKNTLETSGLLVDNFVAAELVLTYDFDTLVRWLLKVSFNSARVDGAHSHHFLQYRRYMLEGIPRPRRGEVSIAVELLAPYLVPQEQRATLSPSVVITDKGMLNPLMFRLGWAPEFENSDVCRLRAVIIGAAVFYIFLFHEGVAVGRAAATLRSFKKSHHCSVELLPARKVVIARRSAMDWLSFYAPQISLQKLLGADG